MAQISEEYAVLVEEDEPLSLVDTDDLSAALAAGSPALNDPAAPLPPAIVVSGDATLSDIAASPVIILMLDTDPAVHGLIVVGADGEIVGVLPAVVIDEYLGSGNFVPRATTMGPASHPGDINVPGAVQLARARVRCRAPGCGFINSLSFFDSHVPPICQNRVPESHRLVLRRF